MFQNLCAQRKHQLTEKDRRHFFMCKKCDVLFPTLFVLKFHLKTCHSTSRPSSSLSKLTISGKTYILNSSFGVSIDAVGNNKNPSSLLNGLMSRNFMHSLQLKSAKDKGGWLSTQQIAKLNLTSIRFRSSLWKYFFLCLWCWWPGD